ncbi:MAG: aldehyde ferredoxin oxidoreductase C-terminal domain-containing protein [Promethearchaeota archaeon]
MRLLRVDMTAGVAREEPLPGNYGLLGGRAMSSRIVADEVPAGADPLGSEAKLVLAPGLLSGTVAPCSGRLSVGGKSPLTGGIKEANVGGRVATALAAHAIRAVVVEGKSEEFQLLYVGQDEGDHLEPCPELVGLGNYEVVAKLYQRYGRGVAVASVGPAGERGYPSASVAVNDLQGHPSRHAARGGLGAVMGSRGLKAIVVVPPGISSVAYYDEETFRATAKRLREHLSTSRRVFSRYGTSLMVNVNNEVGGLPTRNFSSGQFEGAASISGETLNERNEGRGGRHRLACSPGCAIRCSNLVVDERGNHVTSSLEYETICLCGSNLGIDDLDAVARIDHACDDVGVDTIEWGGAVGVAMEAGKLKWGDHEGVLRLLEEARRGEGLGALVARGVKRTGEALGVKRVPHVKGQGISAYDPRVFKAMGCTFATSPMGADHTAGAAIKGRKARADRDYGDLADKEHKLELSLQLQVYTAVMDTCGFCYFIGPSAENLPAVTTLLNARYNWGLSEAEVVGLAKELLRVELAFNRAAGFGEADDDLPEFFRTEPNVPRGTTWDVDPEELRRAWDALDDL